jgi:DNA-binding PadR family transcriptional regulator
MTYSSHAAEDRGFTLFPGRGHRHEAIHAAMMMRGGEPGPGGPWGGPPFGYGGPRGGFRGRHGKARRGDIRTAILLLLAEEPRNGYTIMQELEQRSDGIWRPSPGSVYPALSQLEDEGLVRSVESDGRKLFEITDAGREQLAGRPADAPAPWDTLVGGVSNEVKDLFGVMRQVAVASAQLAQSASATQIAEAKKVLTEARRALYRILGEGDE